MIQNIIRKAYINDDFDFNKISPTFIKLINNNIEKQKNKKWVALGQWLGMKNVKLKKVKNHIRNEWRKIKKELKIKSFDQLPKISIVAHYKSQPLKSFSKLKLEGFHLIIEPEYIINSNN